ncbi:MAG: ribosomal RNA small subunit methyltransferase I, partial [Pseudomonadota bacterium]
ALAAAERGPVALISDAGTPLVSDPGYKLVRAAITAGIPVWTVPGPSAAIAALSLSGLPTDRFHFEGFLSAKTTARRRRLEELKAWRATLIFYEAPNRLAGLLADAAQVLPDRECVVARELTKLYEEVVRGSPQELADWASSAKVRGEVAVLLGPPAETVMDNTNIDALLETVLANNTVRDAVRHVVDATGAPKKAVYARALTLTQEASHTEDTIDPAEDDA